MGDDDLFINQAATKNNTGVEISPESFTVSRVKKSWKGWIEQKRRHLTTWTEYKSSDKIRLGIYPFAQVFFWILFILLIILLQIEKMDQSELYIILSMFLLKTITQLIIFKMAMDKLKEKDLFVISLIAEVFLLGFYPLLTISNRLFRRKQWKKS
jgi:hypothetical protein